MQQGCVQVVGAVCSLAANRLGKVAHIVELWWCLVGGGGGAAALSQSNGCFLSHWQGPCYVHIGAVSFFVGWVQMQCQQSSEQPVGGISCRQSGGAPLWFVTPSVGCISGLLFLSISAW
jgi:hypothetical protein